MLHLSGRDTAQPSEWLRFDMIVIPFQQMVIFQEIYVLQEPVCAKVIFYAFFLFSSSKK